MDLFDFVVYGTPISQQARRRIRLSEWRDKVRGAAELRWPPEEQATQDFVKITVIYFYDRVNFDVDNIVKPIQDSLEGLVYLNDTQVVEARVLKRDLHGSYRIDMVTPVLARALTTGDEFVYVRIEVAQNLEELVL